MDTERQRLPLAGIEVDWLVQAMHSGWDQRGFLDPATGRVHLGFEGGAPLGPDGDEVDLDDVDWIEVDDVDSHTQYEDMTDFADAVADPVLGDRLRRALEGRGAFRRFKDAIYDAPEELRQQWFIVSGARQASRAARWLLDEQLVVESEGTAFVRRQDALADETLEAVEKHSGPARVDVDDVPGRWAEIRRHVEDGSSVLLTDRGEAWGVVEPWSE